MKILYECFSCSPFYGSDEGIGWMWPFLMSKHHDVWALVRNDRREDIERYCQEFNINNIHFIYCDIPNKLNFYYKNKKKGKNKALDFLSYQLLWQFTSLRVAKILHKQEHFDIVHHVTNDFRLIGHLYKLNTHFILGPIGGAQETSAGLSFYIRKHKTKEQFRKILNKFFVNLPGYNRAINTADRIFFSNKETLSYLQPYIKDRRKCFLLTEVGIKITTVQQKSLNKDKTIFMWAGRMEYRKGLELLVDVLKRLPLDKNWEVILCGDGDEREFIQNLCREEKFNDRVIFFGKKPFEDVQKLYDQASAFVFPSLRETTGTVILEAMSHALPVICLDQGGGSLVVNESCGFLIPTDTKDICIEKFSDAMIKCIDSPELINELGVNAQKRVLCNYTWQEKVRYMESVYIDILENG